MPGFWGFLEMTFTCGWDGYTVKSTKEQTDFEQLDERYALKVAVERAESHGTTDSVADYQPIWRIRSRMMAL
jgi:hypothetical protein